MPCDEVFVKGCTRTGCAHHEVFEVGVSVLEPGAFMSIDEEKRNVHAHLESVHWLAHIVQEPLEPIGPMQVFHGDAIGLFDAFGQLHEGGFAQALEREGTEVRGDISRETPVEGAMEDRLAHSIVVARLDSIDFETPVGVRWAQNARDVSLTHLREFRCV